MGRQKTVALPKDCEIWLMMATVTSIAMQLCLMPTSLSDRNFGPSCRCKLRTSYSMYYTRTVSFNAIPVFFMSLYVVKEDFILTKSEHYSAFFSFFFHVFIFGIKSKICNYLRFLGRVTL